MKYSQELFGSKLDISIDSEKNEASIINGCFKEAEMFEQKYSRFIKNNYLDQLNTNKSSYIDNELLSIIQLCIKVSKLSHGYFDITILPILENMGYGISDSILEENIGYQHIQLNGNNIRLNNNVSIDIGAVGKGYIVDKIYNILDKYFEKFTINFGGDIRIKGTEKILLEDPNNVNKYIGEIELENISIASSTGIKRQINQGHHLVNPKSKRSQNDKQAIYLSHRLSSFSDIFSTALFVSPLETSIEMLNSVSGLEGLIITKKGEIFKSKGFTCKLY